MMPPAWQDAVTPRWLVRRDIERVLDIEVASFSEPWTEDRHLQTLRQRACLGMVADIEHQPVGFVIYEVHTARLQVLRMATHPDWRRRGIARLLLERLYDKLTPQRRDAVELLVEENWLPAQLCLRALGYRAVGVKRNRARGVRDAYLFRRERACPPTCRPGCRPPPPRNAPV